MRNETGDRAYTGWRPLLGAGMLALLVLACVPAREAQAQGVVRISGSVGHHHHYTSQYVPGHYETRAETVLVESAHYEQVWVEAQYKTIKLNDGTKISVKIEDGYWSKVYVAERYETRAVQVWVPGYYVERRYERPSIGIGFGFKF